MGPKCQTPPNMATVKTTQSHRHHRPITQSHRYRCHQNPKLRSHRVQTHSKPISPKPKLTANPKISSKPINFFHSKPMIFTINPSPQTHKFISHSKPINVTPNPSISHETHHTKPINFACQCSPNA
jgi:hypothetical protein